ncbi:hypothetical protein [Nannocystis pusilla]|uniref:Uncharacterized protein n=1 Tax=Nannocystis pusilla TaxID=889268 RepID=A0ABS7TRY6_9BACT|nr:hypothetical protein [Nannocystis pusilla]MBZ5710983.1 hypothetical protein [Nannocystis pusilla]
MFAETLARLGKQMPKSVSFVHYGPDGAQVALAGTAVYAEVSEHGAKLQHTSSLAGGAPHAQSEIVIDAQGQVQSSTTQLLNTDGSPRKQISGDYSGLVLNAAGWPASGSVAFAIADAKGKPTHTATLAYAQEVFSTYELTSSGPADQASRVEIAFSKAKFIGTRLVGGELGISYFTSGSVLTTASRSLLTAQGVPSELLSTNYDADGTTVRETVRSDYGGVAFDPRGGIEDGALMVKVYSPQGEERSASVFRFRDGLMVSRGKLKPGEVIAPMIPAPAKPVPGPWSPNRPADHSHETTRADGTLIERRQDWLVPGAGSPTPQRSVITGFSTDGVTPIRTIDIDYRAAQFDMSGQPVGGTVISTRFEGGIRASTTNISY